MLGREFEYALQVYKHYEYKLHHLVFDSKSVASFVTYNTFQELLF